MLTLTNKLRTIVAISAVGAVLAPVGAASAATVAHQPGASTSVIASQPITVAQTIDPNKVGSANGNYTDEDCEDLANEVNFDNQQAQIQGTIASGTLPNTSAHDSAWAMSQLEEANAASAQQELDNNCFVMD
jgi:hypothetical protein